MALLVAAVHFAASAFAPTSRAQHSTAVHAALSRGAMFNVRLVSEDQLSALEKASNAIMTSEDAASAGSKLRIRRVISQLEAQLGVSEPVDEGGAEWFGLIDVDQQAIQAVEDSLASKLEDVALASKLVAQADAFFAAIDVDGNGEISFGELEAHLEDLGFNAGAIDHIFDLLDVNKDGEISKLELRQSFVKYDDPALRLALGLGATEADDVFDAIDVNGDGEISMAELEAYLEVSSSGGGDVQECTRTLFRTLDANGDGRVSRDELREGYAEYTAFRRVLGLA